jgi:hypothetical protein
LLVQRERQRREQDDRLWPERLRRQHDLRVQQLRGDQPNRRVYAGVDQLVFVLGRDVVVVVEQRRRCRLDGAVR